MIVYTEYMSSDTTQFGSATTPLPSNMTPENYDIIPITDEKEVYLELAFRELNQYPDLLRDLHPISNYLKINGDLALYLIARDNLNTALDMVKKYTISYRLLNLEQVLTKVA